MHDQRTARRTHGTGSLLVKNGAYYGNGASTAVRCCASSDPSGRPAHAPG
jgi:hypothetical protein